MFGLRKSLTIIELIATIVIFGLIVPPLLIALSHMTTKVVEAENSSTMVILGRSLMEEIVSKRFDENAFCATSPCLPPCSCWSSTLGPEGGETRNTYDDIDDYDGLVETDVTGFPGFSRQVTVYYVDPKVSDLDTAQADSSRTNYKRIDVQVSNDYIGTMDFSVVLSGQY